MSGKEQGGYLSLALATTCQIWGIALPLSPIQGQLTSTPDSRDSSTVPLWGGTGPTLQSGTLGEGQGQLCATLFSLVSVVTGAMDSKTDGCCGRSADADMAPGSKQSRPRQDTMVLGGITGHLNCHGPNSIVVLEPPRGSRCGPISWASLLSLIVAGALYISTGPVCGRVTDPSLVRVIAQVHTML